MTVTTVTRRRSVTESWLLERTAALAADYLYQLDLPDDFSEDDMPLLADLQHRSAGCSADGGTPAALSLATPRVNLMVALDCTVLWCHALIA